MYQTIAIILVAVAIALLFFLDSVIDKNTSNSTLAYIYKNNQMIASTCLIAAYFAYIQSENEQDLQTFESSIDTDDALNA